MDDRHDNDERIAKMRLLVETRRRLDFEALRVPCLVTGRWLKVTNYSEDSHYGGIFSIDVMTSQGDYDENPRKICHLELTVDELMPVLEEAVRRNTEQKGSVEPD